MRDKIVLVVALVALALFVIGLAPFVFSVATYAITGVLVQPDYGRIIAWLILGAGLTVVLRITEGT